MLVQFWQTCVKIELLLNPCNLTLLSINSNYRINIDSNEQDEVLIIHAAVSEYKLKGQVHTVLSLWFMTACNRKYYCIQIQEAPTAIFLLLHIHTTPLRPEILVGVMDKNGCI